MKFSLVSTRKRKAKNNQNLRPFKPGQSGNPSGRPKKTPLQKHIETLLKDEALQASLTQCLITHAKRGNMAAMKLLLKSATPFGEDEELNGTARD